MSFVLLIFWVGLAARGRARLFIYCGFCIFVVNGRYDFSLFHGIGTGIGIGGASSDPNTWRATGWDARIMRHIPGVK
jgi:hypothetical protein